VVYWNVSASPSCPCTCVVSTGPCTIRPAGRDKNAPGSRQLVRDAFAAVCRLHWGLVTIKFILQENLGI